MGRGALRLQCQTGTFARGYTDDFTIDFQAAGGDA